MRNLILAICCAAAVAIPSGYAHAVSLSFATLLPNGERPPAPTEPSVVVPGAPAAAPAAPVKRVEAPKPAVRRKVVRRWDDASSGPLTMPSEDMLVMMVRAALAGVNQANFTENYSVLHDMTTPALQARVTAEQFGKAFADLRRQNLDLSPALVLSPKFTATPAFTPQGVLKLAGFFPSRPMQINFAIDYRAMGGVWLIDSLSVSALPAGDATQVANAAPSAPAATARTIENTQPTSRFVSSNSPVEMPVTFVSSGQGRPAAQQAKFSPGQRSASGGPFVAAAYVQVSSQKSEAEAQAAFRAMQAAYPNVLASRHAVIRRADLGSKGIYYRAQIGPVSVQQADRLCNDLKAVGGQCFLQYN